jgi:hypothetical protein
LEGVTEMTPRYDATEDITVEIPTTVLDVPCIIGVIYFRRVKGSGDKWGASSDLDYYGFTESDYLLLDRKGQPADWLEKKVDEHWDSRSLREEIEEQIAEHFSEWECRYRAWSRSAATH